MAEITTEKLFNYVYGCFPAIYQKMDSVQALSPLDEHSKPRPLLRTFLESAFYDTDIVTMEGEKECVEHVDGAVGRIVRTSVAFPDLIDPEKNANSVFPELFNSFGLVYNSDIENRLDSNGNSVIYYQRKFLNNIGDLVRRLGTIAGVRYLVRVLTGMEFEYEYERTLNTLTGEHERKLTINLQDLTGDQANSLQHSKGLIEKFISMFVPYYITVNLGRTEAVKPQNLSLNLTENIAVSEISEQVVEDITVYNPWGRVTTTDGDMRIAWGTLYSAESGNLSISDAKFNPDTGELIIN